MKTSVCSVTVGLMLLSACNNEELLYSFEDSFETPSKLLVSVKEDDRLVAAFKYDQLNRLVQEDMYQPGNPVAVSQFFEYNSQNLLISKKYSEYVESYAYNNSGKLASMNMHFKSAADGFEWNQKTEYQYSGNRISKAINFSREGLPISRYEYKYDARGNTIERSEYPHSPDYNGLVLTQLKYVYDQKTNPYPYPGSPYWEMWQPDIVKGNNPTYSYYFNSVMSSLPPEYEFTYEYDATGLPVKVTMKNLKSQGLTKVFVYEYAEKNE